MMKRNVIKGSILLGVLCTGLLLGIMLADKDQANASIGSVTTLAMPTLVGGEWTEEQKEVWNTIEQQWNTFMTDDIDECMSFFHPDFLGWGNNISMPVNITDERKRASFYMKTQEALMINLKPISIKIYGNVAVAHYYFEDIYKDAEGKQIDDSGRYTDILMNEDEKWLFISFHGGVDKTE